MCAICQLDFSLLMERTQKSCPPCVVKEGKTGIMISEVDIIRNVCGGNFLKTLPAYSVNHGRLEIHWLYLSPIYFVSFKFDFNFELSKTPHFFLLKK